jgi:thiamine biosynthesis lipoprotein
MSKIKRHSIILLCLVSLLWLDCSLLAKKKKLFVFTGYTMGTSFTIKVVDDWQKNREKRLGRFRGDIETLLARVSGQMSTFIDSSEVSRFNRYRGKEWFSVSSELVLVVQTALKVSEQSGGTFDITVGPLVNLWGFGPDPSTDQVPAEEDIAKRLSQIGYRYLSCRPMPPALKKAIPDLYCDLSAIAKGYGVDAVAVYLESQGAQNYMVEIGGEIRAKGKNNNDVPWRIGISAPEAGGGVQKIINVTDIGMATSGDYYNYFEKDGVRYSHTIDPRTGYPIKHKLASVTVLHPQCMYADAYATAIDVLGPEDGYDFALKEELPVYMIVKADSGFVEKMTPQFADVLKP